MRAASGLSLAVLISLAVAVLIIGGVALMWDAVGGSPMSVHGWIALVLGGVGVAVLTGVLMGLAFRSSREGHDDTAGKPDPDAPPRRFD